MWLLNSQAENGERYRLLCSKEYTVGRSDAEILLPSDKSISRSHAKVIVTHLEANIAQPYRQPILTITDISRFGTVINGTKFKQQTGDVNSGDVIRFGTQDSLFIAQYEPFIVTSSCLDAAAKKEAKQIIATLGGHLTADWRKECNLLIMSSLSVTVKVICSLINQRPIVTIEYLRALLESSKDKKPDPDPDKFLPPISESQLNPSEVSFKKDIRRKTLFVGKIFIFLSPKQFKKLNGAVEFGGGTPMLMEEGTDDNEDDILYGDNTCVMACDANDVNLSDNAKNWITHVQSLLIEHNKRMITDAELGFAVLYCSTQKHCNPNAPDSSQKPVTLPSQSLSMATLQSQLSSKPKPSTSHVEETQQEARVRRSLGGDKEIIDTSLVLDTERRKSVETPRNKRAQTRGQGQVEAIDETPSQKRKRVYASDSDDESNNLSKQSKVHKTDTNKPLVSGLQIKNEIITPAKPSTPSRIVNKVKMEISDDLDEAFDALPSRRRGRGTRNTSPAPKKSPVVKEPIPDDIDEAFDALPSRRRARSRRSPSPAPQNSPLRKKSPARKQEPDTSTKTKPVAKVEIDMNTDIDEMFDRLPSRRRGRKADSPPPPANSGKSSTSRGGVVLDMTGDIDDAFDALPSRRRRRVTRSPTPPPPSTSKLPSKVKTIDSPVPAKKSPRKSNVPVKQEVITPAKYNVKKTTQNKESSSAVDNTSVFLTTTRPISEQNCRLDRDYQVDGEVAGGMLLEEAALIVRKPGSRANKQPQYMNDGTSTWKGKIVKNFKKFRKTNNSDRIGIPRIIGGTDLFVHKDSSENKDEWMRQFEEEESQRNEEDEALRKLFEEEVNPRRGKKRR